MRNTIDDLIQSRPLDSTVLGSNLPFDHLSSRGRRGTVGKIGWVCRVDDAVGIPILDKCTKPRVVAVNAAYVEHGIGFPESHHRELMVYLGLARGRKSLQRPDGTTRHGSSSHGDSETAKVGFSWCYAGFQFGNLAGQLGDGRCVCLLETTTIEGRPLEIQVKGGISTPYSRGFDGLFARTSAIKEYIMQEYLATLSIPSSRSVALAFTSEDATREGRSVSTAVLVRALTSNVRVGTLEALHYTNQTSVLKACWGWFCAAHEVEHGGVVPSTQHVFVEVSRRIARLVALWIAFGFTHGVMNTDNMSLHGVTIDLGPCAFVPGPPDPDFTLNVDDDHRMYAFGKQRAVGRQTVVRLGVALSSLLFDETANEQEAREVLQSALDTYDLTVDATLNATIARRIGLPRASAADAERLTAALFAALEAVRAAVAGSGNATTADASAWGINEFCRHMQERHGGAGSATFLPPLPHGVSTVSMAKEQRRALDDFVRVYSDVEAQTGASHTTAAPTTCTASAFAANPVFVPYNDIVQAVARRMAAMRATPAAAEMARVMRLMTGDAVFAASAERDRLITEALAATAVDREETPDCGCG